MEMMGHDLVRWGTSIESFRVGTIESYDTLYDPSVEAVSVTKKPSDRQPYLGIRILGFLILFSIILNRF